MTKLLLPLLATALTLTSLTAQAQSAFVSRQHSITGLSDPEPAAPRLAVLDPNTKAYIFPESGQPAEPDAANQPQQWVTPTAPAKTLPDTSISLTRP